MSEQNYSANYCYSVPDGSCRMVSESEIEVDDSIKDCLSDVIRGKVPVSPAKWKFDPSSLNDPHVSGNTDSTVVPPMNVLVIGPFCSGKTAWINLLTTGDRVKFYEPTGRKYVRTMLNKIALFDDNQLGIIPVNFFDVGSDCLPEDVELMMKNIQFHSVVFCTSILPSFDDQESIEYVHKMIAVTREIRNRVMLCSNLDRVRENDIAQFIENNKRVYKHLLEVYPASMISKNKNIYSPLNHIFTKYFGYKVCTMNTV